MQFNITTILTKIIWTLLILHHNSLNHHTISLIWCCVSFENHALNGISLSLSLLKGVGVTISKCGECWRCMEEAVSKIESAWCTLAYFSTIANATSNCSTYAPTTRNPSPSAAPTSVPFYCTSAEPSIVATDIMIATTITQHLDTSWYSPVPSYSYPNPPSHTSQRPPVFSWAAVKIFWIWFTTVWCRYWHSQNLLWADATAWCHCTWQSLASMISFPCCSMLHNCPPNDHNLKPSHPSSDSAPPLSTCYWFHYYCLYSPCLPSPHHSPPSPYESKISFKPYFLNSQSINSTENCLGYLPGICSWTNVTKKPLWWPPPAKGLMCILITACCWVRPYAHPLQPGMCSLQRILWSVGSATLILLSSDRSVIFNSTLYRYSSTAPQLV